MKGRAKINSKRVATVRFRLVFLFFVLLSFLLISVLVLRTVLLPILVENPCFEDHSGYFEEEITAIKKPPLDEDAVIGRFRKGLQIETICWDAGNYNREEIKSIISFIKESYPTIHTSPLVHWEIISNYSLLYKITGSDETLPPILFLAHLDVVPVVNQNWQHPPFSAEILDGYIYARGSIDDKENVFAILESLEMLLQTGHIPKRPFYIAFGHDEECMGRDGAQEIAKELKKRNVYFDFVLDEGMIVLEDVYPSIDTPVAHIGVSEKGMLTVQLSVNYTGGHSSMPDKESSIGILSQAVVKLQSNPHPSMLGYGVELTILETLSYHVGWPLKMIFRNVWFFKPLLSWIMSKKPTSNAVIRTTTAVTMFNSGGKENVIPPYVEAVVNHRIHSAQTVEEVLEYDKYIINDERVRMKVLHSFNPVSESCYLPSCSGYQIIKETIKRIWQDNIIVVPASLVGNTDSIYFRDMSNNIYRFTPIQLKPQDLSMVHGANERISIEAYKTIITYYFNLFLVVDGYHLHPTNRGRTDL